MPTHKVCKNVSSITEAHITQKVENCVLYFLIGIRIVGIG